MQITVFESTYLNAQQYCDNDSAADNVPRKKKSLGVCRLSIQIQIYDPDGEHDVYFPNGSTCDFLCNFFITLNRWDLMMSTFDRLTTKVDCG